MYAEQPRGHRFIAAMFPLHSGSFLGLPGWVFTACSRSADAVLRSERSLALVAETSPGAASKDEIREQSNPMSPLDPAKGAMESA